MASSNITAAKQATCGKPLTSDAMSDLVAFINITKENPQALEAWNEHLNQEKAVIECSTTEDGKPHFFLAKHLSSFMTKASH